MTEHPSPAELLAFAVGDLNDDALAMLEQHLAECDGCAAQAAAAPADDFVAILRRARSSGDTPLAALGTLADSIPVVPKVPTIPPELLEHARYRLQRPLGMGGMGTVWLAEHTVMGRLVALKVIRPEFLTRPGAAERFRREARAAATLDHPGIVAAFDAEQAGDLHFLVMEHIEGETIAQRLARAGRLPVTEACRIARDVALALQHAHERGLVHRDLKPQNIMLDRVGTAKVLDFGLAAFASGMESQLTAGNMVVGTPDYIAPEQAEDSRAADARSDIYSLGCTLYEMLAGRVPFPDESVLRKLDGHRRQRPAPLPSDVPPGLASVIARMMAKDPRRRFQSASEAAAALVPFRDPNQPRRPRRGPMIATALGAVAVACALVFGLVLRVQTGDGDIVITAQSPDVEVMISRGGKEIHIIDTRTQKRVTLPVGDYEVAVKDKPDDITIKTDRVTVRRGREVLVVIERAGPAAGHGGDNAAIDRGLIRSIPLGETDNLGNPLSPDGKSVIVTTGKTAGPVERLQLEDVESGKRIADIAGGEGRIVFASFSTRRDEILYAKQKGNEIDIRLRELAANTELRVHRFENVPPFQSLHVQLSSSQTRLLTESRLVTGVYVEELVFLNPMRIRTSEFPNRTYNDSRYMLRLSRDGSFIVGGSTKRVDRFQPGDQSRAFTNRIVDPYRVTEVPLPAKNQFLNEAIVDVFADSLNSFGAVAYSKEDGYSIYHYTSPFRAPVRHRLGTPGSTAVAIDAAGKRAAVLLPDRRIRVEDVAGWTTGIVATEPLPKVLAHWLSANGRVLAVRLEKELRLYRLPTRSWDEPRKD